MFFTVCAYTFKWQIHRAKYTVGSRSPDWSWRSHPTSATMQCNARRGTIKTNCVSFSDAEYYSGSQTDVMTQYTCKKNFKLFEIVPLQCMYHSLTSSWSSVWMMSACRLVQFNRPPYRVEWKKGTNCAMWCLIGGLWQSSPIRTI